MTSKDKDRETLNLLAHKWRERVTREDATHEDKEALAAWLAEDIRHEDAFDRAETLWAAFDHLKADDIEPDLMPHEVKGPSFTKWVRSALGQRSVRYGLAAFGMALVVIPLGYQTFQAGEAPAPSPEPIRIAYETRTSEITGVVLEDGSAVTLGAATRLEAVFSDDQRRVIVTTGAAYFDVVPDPNHPFTVEAGDLTATARGTAFGVSQSGGVSRVAVAKGAVDVTYPYVIDGVVSGLASRASLGPGDAVSASRQDGLSAVEELPAGDVAAWRDQRLIYKSAPLSELIADVDRYSPDQIILDDSALSLADETLTGSFNASRIDRMLSMISLSYPIEIDDSEPGILRLRAKPTSAD